MSTYVEVCPFPLNSAALKIRNLPIFDNKRFNVVFYGIKMYMINS